MRKSRPLKVSKEESNTEGIVKMLAETNEPILLYELPGWWRDTKDLESQGLLIIDNSKAPRMVSLTQKGKSYVVYGKS